MILDFPGFDKTTNQITFDLEVPLFQIGMQELYFP